MVFKAILLGISSSTPTKDRNPTSLAIRYNSEIILFDAAEGVQQQLMRSKTSYMDIDKIFITHFHADHFLGLPGLLATMSLHERTHTLTIFGPKKIKEKVLTLLDVFELNLKYELNFVEVNEGIIFENKEYYIYAHKMNHSLETYGYIFREKDTPGQFVRQKALDLGIPVGPLFSELKEGKSIKINGKLITPNDVIDKSKIKQGKSVGYFVDFYDLRHKSILSNIDLLFHEASFLDVDKLQAKKTGHSVVASIAKMLEGTSVKKWILVNFSARYKILDSLINEAQTHFPNSEIGIELKEYVLKK